MSDWIPSLNALRAFEATARHLNYPDAAAELHVTPAAVKQLVRKLEAAIGNALFVKRGRGLELTAKGETASRELSSGFRRIIDAVENMRRPDPGSRLVVSCDPSFASLWLLPRLERFKRASPDIDVLIDSSYELADLEKNAADIAIRFAAQADERLITHRLFDERLSVYCSPGLIERFGGPRSIEDLARIPLLEWDLTGYTRASVTSCWNQWRYWLENVGAPHVEPNIALRFSDYNLTLQAAIGRQGAVIGSEPILRDLVSSGLLMRPIAETATPDVGYDIVATHEAANRPEVERFREWIIAEASQSAPDGANGIPERKDLES